MGTPDIDPFQMKRDDIVALCVRLENRASSILLREAPHLASDLKLSAIIIRAFLTIREVGNGGK
jgi:hypothetical protein